MRKQLEILDLTIDDFDESGISAFSFVDRPATKELFVALGEEDEDLDSVELKTMDEEKRLVVGLALVPKKPIYRRKGAFEYFIRVGAETIRKCSEKYLKQLKLHNVTEEHQTMLVDGVYLAESWIVEDSEKDKTAIYGLNAPVGAWAVSFRVENPVVWSKIKDGTYRGFSIEGQFKHNRIQFAEEMEFTQEEMNAYIAINRMLDEAN